MNDKAMMPAKTKRLLVATVIATAVVAIGVTALLVNIFERKQEAKNTYLRVVELTDKTDDPATWGKNFPAQYELYKLTAEMQPTKYAGSEAMPHLRTGADPRSFVARSNLERESRLKTIWAGYAFAIDYRERRGHAYMLDDQTYTGRQKANPPGACVNCHASMVVAFNEVGNGDAMKGFQTINHMPYAEARKLVKHPIGCIDCHDPKTMELRITRPAFIEGVKALKASQGVADYDVNKQATRQEMRTYVCAQCHVTYFFKGPEKTLTFPWSKGLRVENIVAFEDEAQVKEWVHADSGAPMMKARHPEFEMWSQGIHARSGVACADCHMPYRREGGLKISDHQVRSPLLNVNRACQSCHRWPEQELKARVEEIQTRYSSVKSEAMDAVVALIEDIKAAKAAGASDAELQAAREFQRRAGFYVDFVMSENSTGFHAPQESMRVLAEAINLARLGQLALTKRAPAPKMRATAAADTAQLTGRGARP